MLNNENHSADIDIISHVQHTFILLTATVVFLLMTSYGKSRQVAEQ
jgi:hypothetical protein